MALVISRMDIFMPQVPALLKPYIKEMTSKPEVCHCPRTAWTLLNQLRTGVGRFKLYMVVMDLMASNKCECGSKLQDTFYGKPYFQASLQRFRHQRTEKTCWNTS